MTDPRAWELTFIGVAVDGSSRFSWLQPVTVGDSPTRAVVLHGDVESSILVDWRAIQLTVLGELGEGGKSQE